MDPISLLIIALSAFLIACTVDLLYTLKNHNPREELRKYVIGMIKDKIDSTSNSELIESYRQLENDIEDYMEQYRRN